MNDIAPEKPGMDQKVSQGDLDGAKQSLDASALALLIQELEYDEKCLTAFFSTQSSYQVRLSHQKNEWVQKRLDRAKSSVFQWMDSKASQKISECNSYLFFNPKSIQKKNRMGSLTLKATGVFFNENLPEQVVAHCWPEKIDGATAINLMNQIEDSVDKWTQSLQLRTPATF